MLLWTAPSAGMNLSLPIFRAGSMIVTEEMQCPQFILRGKGEDCRMGVLFTLLLPQSFCWPGQQFSNSPCTVNISVTEFKSSFSLNLLQHLAKLQDSRGFYWFLFHFTLLYSILLFLFSYIYSFVHEIFTEKLYCARHYIMFMDIEMNKN